MRVLAVALLVAGCTFRVQATTPPSSGVESPGEPGGNDPGNNGNGGSGGNAGGGGGTGTPSNPPTSGTPTPPPAVLPDMALSTTDTPDMLTTLSVRVGASCNADPDCMLPGLKCFKTLGKGASLVDLPGGYCSKPCDAKTPCPTGSECIASFYGSFCMNICPEDGCRSGYSCCKSVNACGLDIFCGGNGQGGEG